MSNTENNKRIAKNTLMLYFRQILILLVSLYTVRVVLNALGIEDYGIYNVVGGIVTFFSFFSGAMASATQRFFSFALGENNLEKLKVTFTVNWIIYGAIAIVALLLLETVGLWFVYEKLRVPPERFEAVVWIYHFSVFTFMISILSTPFMAIIIAHEDMQIYAYVSIVEALMKLGVVFLLVHIPWDKLELYGMLIFAVSVITTIIYLVICLKKYKECQFRRFYWDKGLLIEIIGFTSWTLFGQITTVVRNQAITILLNQVFNPAIVAARAIANNISGSINVFSSNFNTGLYPPIIKAYSSNDKEAMFSLILNGSKITFFLMWIFALPMFLEMGILLQLWLQNPPPEAILFTQLALVEVLINSISLPLMTAARAPGKMKFYELTLGSIQISIFVASWIVLRMGGAAYTVFVVAIIVNLVMFIVRLVIVRKLVGLSLKRYANHVAFPVLGVVLLSAIPTYFIYFLLPKGLVFSTIVGLTSIIFTTLSTYYLGLDKNWRLKMRHMITNRVGKLF